MQLKIFREPEVAHRYERVCMIISQDHSVFFLLMHMRRFCEFSLLAVRQGEVVHACQCVWMIMSHGQLPFCQHGRGANASGGEFSLPAIRHCEVVHAYHGRLIVRAAYGGADNDHFTQ